LNSSIWLRYDKRTTTQISRLRTLTTCPTGSRGLWISIKRRTTPTNATNAISGLPDFTGTGYTTAFQRHFWIIPARATRIEVTVEGRKDQTINESVWHICSLRKEKDGKLRICIDYRALNLKQFRIAMRYCKVLCRPYQGSRCEQGVKEFCLVKTT
jgi:hypothetical protein